MPTFTPPTTKESSDDRFWGRFGVDVGISVLWNDSTFVERPYPWLGEILPWDDEHLVEGETWFQGGHTYEVSDETGIALHNAGFTVLLNIEASGFGGAAFGVPSIIPGVVTASPSGIAPTSALGADSVSGKYILVPSGIGSTGALGTASAARGAVHVSPSGIAPTSDIGAQSVRLGFTVGWPAVNWPDPADWETFGPEYLVFTTQSGPAPTSGTITSVTVGVAGVGGDGYVAVGDYDAVHGTFKVTAVSGTLAVPSGAGEHTFSVSLAVAAGQYIAVGSPTAGGFDSAADREADCLYALVETVPAINDVFSVTSTGNVPLVRASAH